MYVSTLLEVSVLHLINVEEFFQGNTGNNQLEGRGGDRGSSIIDGRRILYQNRKRPKVYLSIMSYIRKDHL